MQIIVRHLLPLFVLAVLAAACGPPPAGAPQPVTFEQRQVLDTAGPALEAASAALSGERWGEADAAFERALAVLPDEPVYGGLRDQCRYNRACALARKGDDLGAAVREFAASIEHGLREIMRPGPDGWVSGPGLTLVHILADRDLKSIRGRDDFQRALDPFLRAEKVHELASVASRRNPGTVVLLLPPERAAERVVEEWRTALEGAGVNGIALSGPLNERPGEARWVLADGDQRWGVEAITRLLEGPLRNRRRVRFVTLSAGAGAVAWEAALASPGWTEGIAAPGGTFHAEAHVDRLALARPTWRVVLDPEDETAAEMLAAYGADVVRIETVEDRVETARRILAALLGQEPESDADPDPDADSESPK